MGSWEGIMFNEGSRLLQRKASVGKQWEGGNKTGEEKKMEN